MHSQSPQQVKESAERCWEEATSFIMFNNSKSYFSSLEPTLGYNDHGGVVETDTRSKALVNDPPCVLGDDVCPYNIEEARVDGMLESIVNHAVAANACSFDTRKVPESSQRDDDDAGRGREYSTRVVPTDGNTRDDCFNNTCSGSAGAWVAGISKEEESRVLEIQDEDDQVLPQVPGQVVGLKEDANELRSSFGLERGSASRKLPTSKKRKKEAASRKHNKSEKIRRDVINQKMKTLHDLVPYQSKEASKSLLLTEVIHYIKRLQAQVQTMVSMASTVPCETMHFPMATNPGQMRNMD